MGMGAAMDTEPDSPPPSAASIPPPDLPKYVPPAPSIATAPTITAPNVPSPEEARRIHLKVAKDVVDEATLNGAMAPFNPRLLAALIDLLLTLGLWLTLAFLLPNFLPGQLALLVGLAYFVTRDSLPFLGGQSVGKKVMGLKALTIEGTPLVGNWSAGLIRNAALLILPFSLVEIFILITRDDKPERGRRLGDEWAKTKVVIHRPPPST